jgi:hypothetical protein
MTYNKNYSITKVQFNESIQKIYINFESERTFELIKAWLSKLYKEIFIIHILEDDKQKLILLIVPQFAADAINDFLVDYIANLVNAMEKAVNTFENEIEGYAKERVLKFVKKIYE